MLPRLSPQKRVTRVITYRFHIVASNTQEGKCRFRGGSSKKDENRKTEKHKEQQFGSTRDHTSKKNGTHQKTTAVPNNRKIKHPI
jgi:hypothetical protein